MKNFCLLFLAMILFNPPSYASRHNESSYQTVWCQQHNGIMEYENPDKTRVDCLTKDYAVEFDFAHKWAESVGQALFYHLLTGKRALVVLILENPQEDAKHLAKVHYMAKYYDFDVEFITPDNINENSQGQCCVKKCKCHK